MYFKGEAEVGTIVDNDDLDMIKNEILKFQDPQYNHHEVIEAFEETFAEKIGCNYSLAISSCAVGIDMVLKSLKLTPDDEVISCAINFHGTHLAILNTGAKLVLVEANDNLTICVDDLRCKINSRTKAIVITHMNGISCDMDAIDELVLGKNIKIIEDAARALGSKYRGNITGKRSWACVFSFQYKKTITTLGEGGMIVTYDKKLYDTLSEYRSFGLGGSWGTNYKMTSVQAAMGLSQLNKLDMLINKRRELAKHRTNFIKEEKLDLQCPLDNETYFNTYYLYTILLSDNWYKEKRDLLIQNLDKRGIGCVIANTTTYITNKYIYYKCNKPQNLHSEKLGQRILCLPIHPLMTAEENNYIIQIFVEEYEKVRRKINE